MSLAKILKSLFCSNIAVPAARPTWKPTMDRLEDRYAPAAVHMPRVQPRPEIHYTVTDHSDAAALARSRTAKQNVMTFRTLPPDNYQQVFQIHVIHTPPLVRRV